MSQKSTKGTSLRTLFLITLCIFCGVVSSQKTVQDVINAGQCNSSNAATNLSNQIITLSQKMFSCYFADTTSIAELDGKSPISITQILEKHTAVEIEKLFQNKNQKLSLTYGLVGLPEFYIFNGLYKKNSACATQDFMNLLSTSYSDCRLCAGNSFYTSSADQLKVIKENTLVFDIKPDNVVTVSSSNPDFKKLFVESFQLQWNCNNPNDQIQVTGNFDIQTEEKFKQAPIDGFQNVCMKCEVQNCGQCTSDFKSCKACKTGYTMNLDGTCTNCSDSNCQTCSKDSSGNEICSKCNSGYVIHNGTCIKTCPSGYTQTESHCLQCQIGTYGSGSQCIECAKYCKNCNGPKPLDCQTCFEGFIMDVNTGCKPCPTGQCCGTVKCGNDEYRSAEYPYECKKCGNNCATCTGPDAKQCTSCSNGYIMDNGFCMNPSQQLNTYLDSKTNTNKPCHFSCEECVDSSNLCTKCKLDSNYFIKVDTKFKCFTKCPTDYEPTSGISSTDYVECAIKKSLSENDKTTSILIQQAKNRCVSSQYWDIAKKQCIQCATNCLSCTDNDNCDICAQGMYWNVIASTCSPCHSSCTTCSGPSHKECISCKNINTLYPSNGVCDSMASTPNYSITTSQADQFKSSNLFDSNSQLYNLRLGVSQFTTQNTIWKNDSLVDAKQCTFSNFKQYYSSLNDPSLSCQDSQLNRSTMENKGSMTAIYAMLLSLSGVQIDGKLVNPSTLAKYALSNQKYNIFYGFNAGEDFACNQLSCESSLDSYLPNLIASNNMKVSIKQSREIPITVNNVIIDCFSPNSNIDKNKMEEVNTAILYANQSLKTNYKQYFIFDVCGIDMNSKSMIQKQYLVTNYFGNGFFETIGAHLPEGQQTQVFYLGGTNKEQNDFAKKSNTKYINNMESYKVSKVKVIQVEEVDASIDKTAKSYAQIVSNANLDTNTPSKCNCISNTVDYVISNEDSNNELIPIITPQNNFLSKNIDAFSIKHITSVFNLDIDSMKANNLHISSTMAKQIFSKVIDEQISATTKCYNLDNSINQCLQNALIDISFANRQKCINESQIKALVAKSDYLGVINSIQSSQWCLINSDRCAKNIQIIKGCL